MGFRKDAFATVWSVQTSGNIRRANLSTSKKNKETGKYETDFSGFVAFFGDAAKGFDNLKRGDRIKIGDCEVTTRYNKDTKQNYTNYAIYSFESVGRDNGDRQTTSGGHSRSYADSNNDDPF